MRPRIKYRILRFAPGAMALAAGVLLAAGCAKEAEIPAGSVYSDVPILAASELVPDNVVVVPQRGTRAAADPAQPMTLYLVRADETEPNTNTYTPYATTPLSAVRTPGAGAQALTFATPQYYLVSNGKTRLTGWCPDATGMSGSVVSWTLDGSQDVLTAAEKSGNMSTPMPDLRFDHALAQVQVQAYAPDANAQATWGTISRIELLEQAATCTYDFSADAATGAVSPQGAATAAFTVGGISATSIPVGTAAQVGDPVMITPKATASVLKLAVTTSKRGKVTVSMPAGVYEAGKAYVLKLKFKAYTIDGVNAAIGTWQTVDRSEQLVPPPVPPKIGDVRDNGIVFYIDPNDPFTYKVLSITYLATSCKWAKNYTNVYAAGATSNTDGKANSAVIKAYYEANPTLGTTFDDAFPAAALCYNYQGKDGSDPKGSWYLPAKDELKNLWCTYNGYSVNSWTDDNEYTLTGVSTKQAVFNQYLSYAGGDAIGYSHWTSTESSNIEALFFSFGDYYCQIRSQLKGAQLEGVRCIKSN